MASMNIPAKKIAGVVVSAGKMTKTVNVRMVKQQWNRKLRKNFTVPYKILVNDPNSSLVEGDVISTTPERHSKNVLYTVSSIIAPFGKPIEERPPLLTQEQREAIHREKRDRKTERRRERREAEAKQMESANVATSNTKPGDAAEVDVKSAVGNKVGGKDKFTATSSQNKEQQRGSMKARAKG